MFSLRINNEVYGTLWNTGSFMGWGGSTPNKVKCSTEPSSIGSKVLSMVYGGIFNCGSKITL